MDKRKMLIVVAVVAVVWVACLAIVASITSCSSLGEGSTANVVTNIDVNKPVQNRDIELEKGKVKIHIEPTGEGVGNDENGKD